MNLDSSISAVVTGGASGLGAATARSLAAKGVKVAIFDLQKDKGEAVAAEIGGVFCEVNVTSDESVAAGFAKARAANGQERNGARTEKGLCFGPSELREIGHALSSND
jgi:NAD(P)-dependent dehydrogenase (short-subunit alcohol dehydrogenase family)